MTALERRERFVRGPVEAAVDVLAETLEVALALEARLRLAKDRVSRRDPAVVGEAPLIAIGEA